MTGIISTICFFIAVLAVYYILPVKFRWGLLLGGSVFFYASADWKMIVLIAGSIGSSYYAGLKIQDSANQKERRSWLISTIVLLVVILLVFKYFDFFIESMNTLLGLMGLASAGFALKLVMPLGISYYTFKIISYLADIYKGKTDAEKHFGYYALYVSFFPQIMCGPIERAEHFLPQLKYGCKFEEKLFTEGMERMVIGLFKKVVIADRLAGYVGTIFAAPLDYPGIASIMAAVFYSVQIYCDFSGYSDMAIGMAEMLGIRTKENFAYPYFSRDIKEFWKRWHISLSSWLKDYIYIPLGGNRKGKLRAKVNLMITFLVSGLWHGNSWSFVFWGGIHGVWNIFSKPKKTEIPAWKRVIQTMVTFGGVTFTWVFFRAENLTAAFTMLKHSIWDFEISVKEISAAVLPFAGNHTSIASCLTVCLFILFITVFEKRRSTGKGTSILWFAVMFAGIILFGQFGNSSFLYGQF